MKIRLFSITVLLIGVFLIPVAPKTQSAVAAPPRSMATSHAPLDAIGHSASAPLLFIANVGQLDAGVRFQVRGSGASLFLADDALWLTVVDQRSLTAAHQRPMAPASEPTPTIESMRAARPPAIRGVNLKLSFVGANARPQLEPFDRLDTHLSYFHGNQADWHADVPVWAGVRYRELYPRIDLELSGAGGQLEPRLRVRPGADLNAVRLHVDGADGQMLEGDYLRLRTAAGDVTMPLLQVVPDGGLGPSLPKAQPAIAGADISAPFARSSHRSSFVSPQAIGLGYSTFLSGKFDDSASEIAVDSSGAAYVTGETFSSDFPTTPGAWDTNCGDDVPGTCNKNGDFYYYDVFVAKLNAAGTGLAYATFIGGGHGEGGYGIAVDATGAAYVTGYTLSGNFPTTANAYDKTCGTDGLCNYDGTYYYYDGFVVKLNPAGTGLAYATFLGGANGDWNNAIAVDGNGAAYITGRTYAPDFPATPGAFDETCGNDGSCDFVNNTFYYDSFAAKLNTNGTDLVYSTFLGGRNIETGYAIAVDSSGAAYITGNTISDNFPTTSGAFDEQCGTEGTCDFDGQYVYYDTFVVKMNATGSDQAYATYLGGSNSDGGFGIAVDQSGAAYITGFTYSSDGFPISDGAYDSSLNGLDDGFVVKLDPSGSSRIYATFLGGSEGENGRGIAVDGSGNAYVAGLTFSSGFPTTPNGYDVSMNGADDAFVVKLNTLGTQLEFATFLGGDSIDAALGIALNGTDIIYVAGLTSSANFPISQGAYNGSYAGNTCGTEPDSYPCYDTFVTKLAPPPGPAPQFSRVFIPLAARVIASAPPLCDAFEPNDDRRSNPQKLEAGQPSQAKICSNDEDNYFFDITRNAKPTITLDLPSALRQKTLIWVYNQTNLGATICGNGNLPASARITISNCPVLSAGRYIVRLYTDNSATDFDNQNPYTLLVAF